MSANGRFPPPWSVEELNAKRSLSPAGFKDRLPMAGCHEGDRRNSSSSRPVCGFLVDWRREVAGHRNWSRPLPLKDQMYDDDKIHSSLTTGGPGYLEMDEAFCTRMRAAIAVGLESAPIGVVTTPGTKNPRYVPTPIKPRLEPVS
jgi:hypothetical protein